MHYARLNHSHVARSAPLVGAARGSAQRPKPCTAVFEYIDTVVNTYQCGAVLDQTRSMIVPVLVPVLNVDLATVGIPS